jgi:hypothetical protein
MKGSRTRPILPINHLIVLQSTQVRTEILVFSRPRCHHEILCLRRSVRPLFRVSGPNLQHHICTCKRPVRQIQLPVSLKKSCCSTSAIARRQTECSASLLTYSGRLNAGFPTYPSAYANAPKRPTSSMVARTMTLCVTASTTRSTLM